MYGGSYARDTDIIFIANVDVFDGDLNVVDDLGDD